MSATSHANVYDSALLDEIVREQKLSRELVKKAANEILLIIKEGLLRDGVVRINHFGSFKLKRLAARKGRNPQTGEVITIPERNKVMFTPCKALREMIEPVNTRPVAVPAATTEPVQVQKTETELVFPQPVPEPVHLKTASQSDFAIEQPGCSKTEHNRMEANEAALQISARGKNSGQNKLIYFGITATIIAILVIMSMPQTQETQTQYVAVPEPGKTVVVKPVVSELEHKPVEAESMPVSIMATPTEEPVAANRVAKQKTESESAQIISSQTATPLTELQHTELETVAVKKQSHSQFPENNTATIEKATAEVQQSTSKVIPAETIETPVVLAVTETPSPEQAQIAAEFFFTGQTYRLLAGNSLWQLSERFYSEPLYWPHIFYSNSDTLSNPDQLPQGHTISMPTLEGQPGSLSSLDRKSIAEGYFLVYTFYKERGHPDAIYALLEAKRYSAEVVERNRHTLRLSGIEHLLLNQQEESADL